MTLLEVADLSTVWVEADVYEKDIAFLQVGRRTWRRPSRHGRALSSPENSP